MAAQAVLSEITGKVWKVLCPVGTEVGEEEPILIIESMKMEIPVCADAPGTIIEISVQPGDVVREGDLLVLLA